MGALAFAFVIPAVLDAQVLEVRLVDETTRAPVVGAIVRLLRDNAVAAEALSNELGRITIRVPSGAYRMQAARIGHSGRISDSLVIAAGETIRRELIMPTTPVQLTALEVRGSTPCKAPEHGGALALSMWEEVRKVLTANVITQRNLQVALLVREFERELNRSGRVLREWTVSASVVHGQPYASLPPAVLARDGFVSRTEEEITYAAPDARLLLSEEFSTTHCFRAIPARGALIGLGFEPIPGRRLADVQGTLWLDRSTGELRYLEYTYAGLQGELERVELGGRVEFRRLPTGAWIVGYWHIRMPRLESQVRRRIGVAQTIVSLVGFLERGGRVQPSSGPSGNSFRALVVGRVYDSTTLRGLQGAVVRLSGVGDSAVTDESGLFVLSAPTGGSRTVTATHWKLAVGGAAPIRDIVASVGDTVRLEFAVASTPTMARSICGSSRGKSGLLGVAWDDRGQPARGWILRILWRSGGGVLERTAHTGTDGAFAFCDLPAGPTLSLAMEDRSRVLPGGRLVLEAPTFRWMEVRPVVQTPALASEPSATATLTGIVLEDSTDRPLSGVEVVIEGSGQRGATNESGRYVLGGVTPGRHIILFRSIGYRPDRQWIRAVGGDTVWLGASLVPSVVQLEPIQVTAERPRPRGIGREGFEERRRTGFGKFIDSTELRRSEHLRVPDVLRRHNIRLVRWRECEGQKCGPFELRAASLRQMARGGQCWMQVVLDGVVLYRSTSPSGRPGPLDPIPPDFQRDFDVWALESIEVYEGSGDVPTEYAGAGAACGTILLWTRRG